MNTPPYKMYDNIKGTTLFYINDNAMTLLDVNGKFVKRMVLFCEKCEQLMAYKYKDLKKKLPKCKCQI